MQPVRSINARNVTNLGQAPATNVKLDTSSRMVDVLIAILTPRVCTARVVTVRQSAQPALLVIDWTKAFARRVRLILALNATQGPVVVTNASQVCSLMRLANVCLVRHPAKNVKVLISALSVYQRSIV